MTQMDIKKAKWVLWEKWQTQLSGETEEEYEGGELKIQTYHKLPPMIIFPASGNFFVSSNFHGGTDCIKYIHTRTSLRLKMLRFDFSTYSSISSPSYFELRRPLSLPSSGLLSFVST